MKCAFLNCPYYPLIFSAWAGANSKPMGNVLFFSTCPLSATLPALHRHAQEGSSPGQPQGARAPQGCSCAAWRCRAALPQGACSGCAHPICPAARLLHAPRRAAVAGRPRSRSTYRPPPQFRQRARSLPARHIRLYLGCDEHLAVLLLPALGYLGMISSRTYCSDKSSDSTQGAWKAIIEHHLCRAGAQQQAAVPSAWAPPAQQTAAAGCPAPTGSILLCRHRPPRAREDLPKGATHT